jgi:hypothetical protein
LSGIRYIANVLNQKGAPAIFEDTFANRPTAGYTGRIFISTDTFVIQRDNGTGWDSLGGGVTGTGAAGQVTLWTGASAVSGDNNLFWDNTNKRLGIGINTPTWPVSSYIAGVNASYFHFINGSTGPGSANGSLFGIDGFGNATILVQGGFNFNLFTGGTARVTFDNAGKVGFGYTTPGITGISVSGSVYQGNNVANALYEMFCNGNLYSPGFAFNITTVGVNTIMTRTSCAYVCTATLTLTLPAVSGLNNQFYVIARTGATVTVQRAGSDTITDKTGTTGLTSVTVAAGTRSMFYLGGGSETIQIF